MVSVLCRTPNRKVRSRILRFAKPKKRGPVNEVSSAVEAIGESSTPLSQTVTITRNGTVAQAAWQHFGPYAASAGEVRVVLTGTGDADLYVRKGAQPTTSLYDCRPYKTGSSETCTLTLTADTQLHVSVRGFAATSTFQVSITHQVPATPVTVTKSGTVAQGAWQYYGPFDARTGDFSAVMTGTGDADLYVRKGAQPTISAYDCRPYATGSGESCVWWRQNFPGYGTAGEL